VLEVLAGTGEAIVQSGGKRLSVPATSLELLVR